MWAELVANQPCSSMPQPPPEHNPTSPITNPRRIRFSLIGFPSDALSVKRLRAVFPDQFDTGEGSLTDGYDNMFFPIDHEQPPQLVQLAEMISHERTLAEYGFYRAIETRPGEHLDEECRWCASVSRRELERSYQQFKLADSPEAARLLIRQVEDQGHQQAEQVKSRSR
jgi:hypothetical protein